MNDDRQIFIYLLSRACRITENVCEIIAVRFGILKTFINIQLDITDDIVMACCTLHNSLCTACPQSACRFTAWIKRIQKLALLIVDCEPTQQT